MGNVPLHASIFFLTQPARDWSQQQAAQESCPRGQRYFFQDSMFFVGGFRGFHCFVQPRPSQREMKQNKQHEEPIMKNESMI